MLGTVTIIRTMVVQHIAEVCNISRMSLGKCADGIRTQTTGNRTADVGRAITTDVKRK
jgi:hypothetical protein